MVLGSEADDWVGVGGVISKADDWVGVGGVRSKADDWVGVSGVRSIQDRGRLVVYDCFLCLQ